jgi:hypothetical protein
MHCAANWNQPPARCAATRQASPQNLRRTLAVGGSGLRQTAHFRRFKSMPLAMTVFASRSPKAQQRVEQ